MTDSVFLTQNRDWQIARVLVPVIWALLTVEVLWREIGTLPLLGPAPKHITLWTFMLAIWSIVGTVGFVVSFFGTAKGHRTWQRMKEKSHIWLPCLYAVIGCIVWLMNPVAAVLLSLFLLVWPALLMIGVHDFLLKRGHISDCLPAVAGFLLGCLYFYLWQLKADPVLSGMFFLFGAIYVLVAIIISDTLVPIWHASVRRLVRS